MRKTYFETRERWGTPRYRIFAEHAAFMLLLLILAVVFWISLSTVAQAAGFNNTLAGSAAQTTVKQARQTQSAPSAGADTLGAQRAPAAQARPNAPAIGFGPDEPWRIRIFEAAVVNGPMVLLGEIAEPAGPMPEALWNELAASQLWLAPEDSGKPVNLTRPRLQQAMAGSMGQDFAALCLYPPSTMLQRGGKLLDAAAVQDMTVKILAPFLAALPGEAQFSDFRLPGNVFLAHNAQTFELEEPQKVAPGRLSLRYSIKELDGTVARRLTGSVFIDCWAAVPTVTAPINKGELVKPENITFVRKNLAYMREMPWDGRGGPWQAGRAISLDQPIFESDLSYVPTIKKGSIVKLVFASGTVRLSAAVEALSDGVSGETIPVKNVQSKRQVYAVVYDANTVVVYSAAVQLAQTPGQVANVTPVAGGRGEL